MTLAIWTGIFVGAFVLGMIALGFVASKKTEDNDDWATARKSYGPIAVGLTMVATYASGALFIGGSGMGYSVGYPIMWYSLAFPLGSFCGVLLFGRFTQSMHKQGLRTFGEYFGARYQSDFMRIAMAIVSICLFFYISSQVISAGTILELLMGIPYKVAIWVSTVLILIYITGGGAHSDFLTDTAQAIAMIVLSIICIIICVTTPGVEGGMTAVNDILVSINPEMGWNSLFNSQVKQFSNAFFAGMILFMTIPFAIQPQLALKLVALKNPRDSKKAIMFGLIVAFLFQIASSLTGITAHAIIPEGLQRADMALVTVLVKVFEKTPLVAALLCSFIIAAVMSTVDGLFLSMGQIVSNDIYRLTIAPRRGHTPEQIEKTTLKISRVSTILIAVIATLLATNPPASILQYLSLGGSCIFCCAAGPMIFGALWKGTTKMGAILAFCITVPIYWFFGLVLKWPSMSTPGLVFIINMSLTFIISKVTPQTFTPEHLRKFGFKV